MNRPKGKLNLAFFAPGLCLIALVILVSLLVSSLSSENNPQLRKPNDGNTNAENPASEPASVVPVARPESEWLKKHDRLVKLAHSSHPDIAFFGDSITEAMNIDLLRKYFGPQTITFGIAGDRTQHLLWRLRHGELDFTSPGPKAFVLLIGTNNISEWPGNPSSTNEEIALGVQADLNEIRRRFPQAKILLLAMLPRDELPTSNTRERVNAANALIKKLADNKHICFADIGSAMLEPDGKISSSLMSDFLHPTENKGYERLFTTMKPHLVQILDKVNTEN